MKYSEMYPELFTDLTPQQTDSLNWTLTTNRLAGYSIPRSFVEDLVDLTSGRIDDNEYLRRGFAHIGRELPRSFSSREI